MLHAIPIGHDGQHARHAVNSLASLTASLSDGRVHLLLAASGSVATIKLPLLIRALGSRHANLSIRVLLTPAAARFLAGQAPEQPPVSSLSPSSSLHQVQPLQPRQPSALPRPAEERARLA